jgi:hypothetical protein
MYSELELLVMDDMLRLGYDPHDKNQVIEYWEERL